MEVRGLECQMVRRDVDRSTVPNQIPREPEDGEAPKNSALGKNAGETREGVQYRELLYGACVMGMQGRDMHGTSLRCGGYTQIPSVGCLIDAVRVSHRCCTGVSYQLPVFQREEKSHQPILVFGCSGLMHDRVLYIHAIHPIHPILYTIWYNYHRLLVLQVLLYYLYAKQYYPRTMYTTTFNHIAVLELCSCMQPVSPSHTRCPKAQSPRPTQQSIHTTNPVYCQPAAVLYTVND
jgi:hypothetical protein